MNFTEHFRATVCRNSTVFTIGVLERSSHSQMFYKIQRENTCAGIIYLNKAAVLSVNFIKKRLQCKCSPTDFAKFLLTPFLRNTSGTIGTNPAGNYMFKVNNRNIRTRCEICSKLTIKIPERSKRQG